MTRAEADQFIRKLKDLNYDADLLHVCGDTYAVEIPHIPLTIATGKQARFVLKYIKPRT